MKDRMTGVVLVLVSAVLLVAIGCGEEPAEEPAPEPSPEAEVTEDVQYARELWAQISDYQTWTEPEGFQGWQEGMSPHGAVLRYYVNDVAEEDLMSDGAIIVKANYSEEGEDALKSVTIMEKREGYDPETGDWFYVKYAPDGTIMENPQGKKLAGLVGKGGAKGCIPCHASAGGDDYLFMND